MPSQAEADAGDAKQSTIWRECANELLTCSGRLLAGGYGEALQRHGAHAAGTLALGAAAILSICGFRLHRFIAQQLLL